MILSGKNIRKSYTQDQIETPVLKGVDIKLHAGEFVAIMGKSGSGKSTLLHILSGLDTPNTGEVYFEGKKSHIGAKKKLLSFAENRSALSFSCPKWSKISISWTISCCLQLDTKPIKKRSSTGRRN